VSDFITAEFPDLNLAEAIQRITGVAMTRNNGEGEKVAVRGLAPNFTRVEIDGRASMVTVDDSAPERDAQLSVFNSDLYSKIEVIKSPSARDVEGGIGGSVKLSTHDPLDVGGLSWGTDVSYSNSATKDTGESGFSGYYSNIFGDGKWGILVHGTYEDRDRRIDKVQANPTYQVIGTGSLDDDEDPAALALVGSVAPSRTCYEYRGGDNPRMNANMKTQLPLSEDLEFFFSSVESGVRLAESEFNRKQVRFFADHAGLTMASDTAPYGPNGTLFGGAGSAGFPTDIHDVNSLNLLADRPLSGPIVFSCGQWRRCVCGQ